ncbi:MAG: Iron-sulfur cluster carrier protein [Anaerolineales bacterium]|nr:Iron-sulfur cluster carrier protein [Anaerolineales bacterium]WKZ47781.1 MAG: polysaccharide biosynthesis tyrosine autokinase [Anaerolineales bacterium]
MELNPYLKPLIKWWRLLVVTVALAVVSSSISVIFQPAQYVSRTTLMIGSTFLNPNPDSGQIYIAMQLATIYADIAKREPIQDATMESLGIDWLPPYTVRVVENTQLIEILVTDTNPERAQIIANELAYQLIQQSPAVNQSETGQRQEFIKTQLSSLEFQIQDTQKQIEELQNALTTMNSTSQIAKTEQDIKNLADKLVGLRANYATFLANSQEGALNILTVVEPANLPTKTSGTSKFVIILLAALVGLVLAVAAVYGLEYLDRTIKTTSDVERVFNLPVIGYLASISENGNNATYVVSHPNSLVAENFRLLHSNLEFFQAYNASKTILVTSPTQGNGKTTIAVNLALTVAASDQKVAIVDADLRRPAVHTALKIPQGPGLADIIHSKINVKEVVRSVKGKDIDVVAAGSIPPSVTEVVGSKKIAAILKDLRDDYDTIIVDAPPLVISDSYNLASKVDGVILVLEPGLTKDDQAKVIKEQLTRAGAKVIGIVFNKVSSVSAKSYGDTKYLSMYSPQHYNDYVANKPAVEEPDSGSKKLLAFFEHGEVPPDVKESLETAFEKFQDQRKNLFEKIRKPAKSKK